MKQENNENGDIRAIRDMMERSSRFLSLSGLSGVFAGLYAIAGALVAWHFVLDGGFEISGEYPGGGSNPGSRLLLMVDASAVLVAAIVTALWLSARKASREGHKIWSPVTVRLLSDLSVPLFAGGIFSLVFLFTGNAVFIAPAMLVFYGIALVNVSRYTFGEVRYLGLSEILTGLVALFFPGHGLIFWIAGFGLLHIAYGIILQRKYH
ncbi:MAG: hypothetical protein R2744_04275 [Bacteroidales bacterium]